MSFVYATKTKTTYNNTIIERMCILSDMRITECNPACWGKETAALIEKHGIHKSVLVAPNCCVSFAGNNILHANRLIAEVSEWGQCEFDQIVQKALEIHCEAKINEIEFILCYVEGGENRIVCIKDKKAEECECAWIGSQYAFRRLQELRHMNEEKKSGKSLFSLFCDAVDTCGDSAVGGYCTYLTSIDDKFQYPEITISGRQTVRPQQNLDFYGSIPEGRSNIHFGFLDNDLLIRFTPGNISILYTNKYRYDQEGADIVNTKYLKCPLVLHSDSLQALKPNSI